MNQNHNISAVIQLIDICKSFGPTKALQNINLTIYPGDVIGLVGANGAGKSTLMKILTGTYTPTSGKIIVSGEEVSQHYGTAVAKKYGISCAYQELSLCTNLSVYENFFMKRSNHRLIEKPGWRQSERSRTDALLNEVFPDSGINAFQLVENLSLDERQMVEICAASVQQDLRVLVLDEPTSSLTLNRIDQLHEKVRTLSAQGVAVIYISHKIDEITRICNRVVILKSGQEIWNGCISDTSADDLIKKMGGENSTRTVMSNTDTTAPIALKLNHYSSSSLHDICFQAKKGEIIGISGLAGSGQRELINAIFNAGCSKKHRGIELQGKVAYVSGDRASEGIFPLWDIANNINISAFRRLARKGILRQKQCDEHAQGWFERLKFKALGIDDDIMSLSGGNQQKALIARGLASDADIIVLNDPTCGVDVETKRDIYKMLHEAASAGRTIIWHSTEDREMEQCDRVLVMRHGCLSAELSGQNITVKNIISASFSNEQNSNAKNSMSSKYKSTVTSHRIWLPLIIFLIVFSLNVILRPTLLSYMGIKLLFKSSVPLVFVGLGQMFMILAGGMDLSNGMALGLVNVVVAFLLATHPLLGLICLLLIVVGYGALGALIHATRIPPIVVTLGASYVWLGLGLSVSSTPGGKCPEWLASIYNFNMPIIPMPIILALIGGLTAYWIIMRSQYGIIMRAAGNNANAVTRAGWSHFKATIFTYAISGVFVVLGGLFITAVANGGDCNAYASYQLLSIATIIIGGCELSGGLTSPLGVMIGALALSSITTLMTFLDVNSNLQSAVTGCILIVALAFKLLNRKRVN